MITIPILIGFDNNKQIGTMTLDETTLPSDNTNYVFSLAYRAECTEKLTPVEYFGNYQLLAVSLMTDTEYLKYLNQTPVSVKAAHDTPNVLDGVRFPDGSPT